MLSLALPIPVRMGMSIESDTSEVSLPGSTPMVSPPAACREDKHWPKQGTPWGMGRGCAVACRCDAGSHVEQCP